MIEHELVKEQDESESRYESSPIGMGGTTDDEWTTAQVVNRWNGDTWLIVKDGYSHRDTNKPPVQTVAIRMNAAQRESLIQALQKAGGGL